MPPEGVVYRPKTEADRPFLLYVYATTREDEMAMVQWTAEQKAEFIRMQFNAQYAHYEEFYPEASFLVIERDGRPIGRIYIDRGPEEICLVDIALLPEARGAGLGTLLVQEILAEGQAEGKAVSIYVERHNPALRMYQRLGFEALREEGVYYEMRWTPSGNEAVK
jgi:ribosomal protein S18 acetylase RimI-like enzyme